jgi:PAS domain S-box-containing protein
VKRLQPDLVRIWTMSENLECLIACTAAGVACIQRPESPDMPSVSPELTRVAANIGATYWHDGIPELWPGCDQDFRAGGLTAGVGFPLITNGRVTGVVVLLGRTMPPRAMIDALESVTDEIAVAIERHQAQGAVARAETRYRRLVEATIEGIVIHDRRRVLDANPSFAAMLGYTLDEVIGRQPFDFIAPEYHAAVRERLVSNYQAPYEVEGLRKDGSRFPVELKGSDYTDQGTSLRVAAVRDITDRKAAQNTVEQLHEEQQARALAERTRAQAEFLAETSARLASSLDTTTMLTQLAHLSIPMLADYCVVSTIANGSMQRVAVVHGDPEREPILRASVEQWPAAFPPLHPIFAALSRNEPYLVSEMTEERIAEIAVAPAHREFLHALAPLSLMAVPISNRREVMGSIIFSSTRPGRHYGADDLALANEFAHRAALALQSAQSFHASQAATRARDEMLAVVAHDLRNPLNTIFMGSELALELSAQSPDAAGRRQLEIIRRSAQHMNRLIQDLLDASRIDSGALTLDLSLLTPAKLLHEAGEMLAPLAAHEKIRFQLHAEPDLPPLTGDKERILQVLSNLVGNAIKFTPAGGSVTLSADRFLDPTSSSTFVRFSVCDTGTGIPAEQLPHIFARGWQARRGDRRGIGLGLAIASGIVEAHGGKIWVDSKYGAGSTFLFTVPVAESPVAAVLAANIAANP